MELPFHLPCAELNEIDSSSQVQASSGKNPNLATSLQRRTFKWTRMHKNVLQVLLQIKYQVVSSATVGIFCHPNSRWWPLTVQHSKGTCGWGADEEVVFYCTSSPPHATSKPVPFRESWRRSGNRWQLLTMRKRGAKVMKMMQDNVL